MKKTKRTIPTKRSYATVVIALMGIAIALFLLKDSTFDNKKNIADNATSNQPSTKQSATQPPIQTAASPVDSSLTASPAPKTPQALPTPPNKELQSTNPSCQKISDDLQLFFKHLDNQEYITAYTQKEPIQKHLTSIITKVLDTPPINEKETADLLTVIKNAAHFFRILGIKDLSLLRDILTTEHSSLEQQLASFYAWSLAGKECHNNASIQIQLPLAKTYEYAAFFLNTLGGQSYLSRREPTLRILTRYYCVLILHRANQQSINKYNLNLSYHLNAVIKDISTSDFLENQASYLDTLQKIKVGR